MPGTEVRIATAIPAQVAEARWPALVATLDAGERQRSERFAFEADRRAYILAHALRRQVLAAELGVAPADLQFAEDEHGKPFLRQPADGHLHFSLSHSRHGVACAVTRLAPVGVDVEPLDAARADAEVLGTYLAQEPPGTAADFFGCWTMLEAFWKAWGTGLAEGNPRLLLQPGPDGTLVRFEGADEAVRGIAYRSTLPGCAIAVALRMPFTGTASIEAKPTML